METGAWYLGFLFTHQMSGLFWSRPLAGFDPIDPDLGLSQPRKTFLHLFFPMLERKALTMWPCNDEVWAVLR
jgi:hypothetical protein